MNHPRTRAIALLCQAIESRLAKVSAPDLPLEINPWDVWWASARADLTSTDLALDRVDVNTGCAQCASAARRLAGRTPLRRIDPDATRGCDCLASWARAMRSAFTPPTWPSWRVTLAVIKPGTNTAEAQRLLADSYTVLSDEQRRLAVEDVRRLYPDAYGGPFRARQVAFLTSEPVRVLVLLAADGTTSEQHHATKRRIRRQLGVGDDLRNHLHMADNPGEAWCDVMHLAGRTVAHQLYERYERDRTADNLAVYRDLLARWARSTHAPRV